MGLGISGLAVGPIQSNCYIIWDEATLKGAIVDPGGDPDSIKDSVEAAGCCVEWILLTHGHFDHVFYAGVIAEFYNAKVAIHPADVTLIGDSLGIAEMYYNMAEYVGIYPELLLADGDIITLGETSIYTMHTPGHSLGGVCFHSGDVVFTGDTIFSGSVGRTDFTGGSMDELTSSIRTKLYVLEDSVVLYPGHGLETTVGVEKRTNPYIQGVI